MSKRPLQAHIAPSRTLLHLGWRYLLRHPWQSVLMIIGITLGVAVAVAIDLANVSAARAFDLSTAAVTGKATHEILGGPQGIDERLYTLLRRQGIAPSAPIIEEYVSSPQLGNIPLQLLGVDPFAEPPFRNYLVAQGSLPVGQLTAFFTQPNTILISDDLTRAYGLAVGSELALDVLGRRHIVVIVGLLKPTDTFSRRLLGNLILADIATAQELTGRIGRLDRIDLILPSDSQGALDRVKGFLPSDVRIVPAAARSRAVEQMTAAFRTNLTALSLLALVVGMFLIYNTMTFSVVQRRSLFGTLRCLGVTRGEVFLLVSGEALIVGLLGSVLGIALGIVLGQASVRLTTQTINDLYFVLNVRQVDVPPLSMIKGALLGVAATLVAAAMPAWEAASVPPRQALLRSGIESKARRAIQIVALGGVVVIIAGVALLALPTRSLIVGFGGICAVVVGFAMLTPLAMTLFMRWAALLTGRLWGTLGRMAPRNVINSLSRTSVAIAALMIAISVAIGIAVMIGSFRYTVVAWLNQVMHGDIYISGPGLVASQNSATIAPAALDIIRQWPGIARVDTMRAALVDSPLGPIQVVAVDNPDYPRVRSYLASDLPPGAIWQAMQGGTVIVSEPFANRVGLPRRGGTVTLYTDHGPHVFPVVGIYFDYSTSDGIVVMSLDTYRQLWDDRSLTAVALRLAPGSDVDAVASTLQQALAPIQQLSVQPSRALRADVLTIFDRTFAITSALRILATLVAFVGVLSALLSLQLERQHELGVLRAIGLTPRQIQGLVFLETGLMGAVAGLLAMPAGYAVSLILVHVINSRSFGWSLQMQVRPAPFIEALAVAVIAALLAGVYPAHRMTQLITAEALRFE